MNFDDWLRDGSIRSFKPVKTQIADLLSSAEKDIQAAGDLMKLGHFALGRDTAYEAMLKAGMALMFHHGYRPEAGSHHVTIVRFTEHVLGSRHESIITAFDRLRRTRHQRLYRGKEAASRSQTEKAIDAARHLLKLVHKLTT